MQALRNTPLYIPEYALDNNEIWFNLGARMCWQNTSKGNDILGLVRVRYCKDTSKVR